METIHPLLFPFSCTWFASSLLFSLSLYFAVIASSYGNLPESIFYMSCVFFRLNFSPQDGRYGWLSGRCENAMSNTERTKKSISFRVAKVDYWFHGRVRTAMPRKAPPYRATPRHATPHHAMPYHATPCYSMPCHVGGLPDVKLETFRLRTWD